MRNYSPINRRGEYSPIRSSSNLGLPPSLRPFALAYWDARQRPSVSLPLTNLVAGGNFPDATAWTAELGCAISAASNTLSIVGNGTNSFTIASQVTATNVRPSGLVKVRARVRATNANCLNLKLEIDGSTAGTETNIGQSSPSENTWYTLTAVLTQNANFTGKLKVLVYGNYADAATANGKTIEVQYVEAIDLTGDFLSGNEPATLELDTILAAYSATSWFDGTKSLVVSPNQQIFWGDTQVSNPMKLRNYAYNGTTSGFISSPDALRSDGTDDYGRRGLLAPVASGSDCTIAVRYRTSDVTAARKITYGDNMADKGLHLDLTGTNLVLTVDDGTAAKTVSQSVAGNNNKFITAIGSYNSADKKGYLWFNGTFVNASAAMAGHMVALSNILVSNNSALTGYTSGDYGEIGLFNKFFTNEDAKAFHNRHASIYGQVVL